MGTGHHKKNGATFSDLKGWYSSPLGQSLGREEAEALDEVLPTLFGYHLVLAAPPWVSNDLGSSRIRHRMVLYPELGSNSSDCSLFGGSESLPVQTDSLDALVLPHALEVARDPHQVLREADRCLIPEGHLVIFGFNPWGTWGAWRLVARLRGSAPWTGHFYSVARVKDWLSLLGFETRVTKPLFYRLPVTDHGIPHGDGKMASLMRRGGSMAAGAYMLVARKRELGMTPLQSRWRPRAILEPGLVEPTSRRAG